MMFKLGDRVIVKEDSGFSEQRQDGPGRICRIDNTRQLPIQVEFDNPQVDPNSYNEIDLEDFVETKVETKPISFKPTKSHKIKIQEDAVTIF